MQWELSCSLSMSLCMGVCSFLWAHVSDIPLIYQSPILKHSQYFCNILLLFLQKTKEALFTILGDLRPSDHFNFVSFSNRVRVWQLDKLVPVTPNNVRDAKKFIYMISPTGGTTPYILFSPPATPCTTSLLFISVLQTQVKCTVYVQ